MVHIEKKQTINQREPYELPSHPLKIQAFRTQEKNHTEHKDLRGLEKKKQREVLDSPHHYIALPQQVSSQAASGALAMNSRLTALSKGRCCTVGMAWLVSYVSHICIEAFSVCMCRDFRIA